MVARGSHVYVDTNVILESHRCSCWKALAKAFALDTVCKCIEECATGNRSACAVQVDCDDLVRQLAPKSVQPEWVIELTVRLGGKVFLDPGEAELLAYVMHEADAWFLCSPDRAAIRAAWLLGLLDRVVALETMTSQTGSRPALRRHFTAPWLVQMRTDLTLEGMA